MCKHRSIAKKAGIIRIKIFINALLAFSVLPVTGLPIRVRYLSIGTNDNEKEKLLNALRTIL